MIQTGSIVFHPIHRVGVVKLQIGTSFFIAFVADEDGWCHRQELEDAETHFTREERFGVLNFRDYEHAKPQYSEAKKLSTMSGSMNLFLGWQPMVLSVTTGYKPRNPRPIKYDGRKVEKEPAEEYSFIEFKQDEESAKETYLADCGTAPWEGEIRKKEDKFGSLHRHKRAVLSVEDRKEEYEEYEEAKIIGHNVRIIDGVEHNVPLYSTGGYARLFGRCKTSRTTNIHIPWEVICQKQAEDAKAFIDNTPRVPVPEPAPKACIPCRRGEHKCLLVAKTNAKLEDIRSRFMSGDLFAQLLFDERRYDDLWFMAKVSLKMTKEERDWYKCFNLNPNRVQPWDIAKSEFEYILSSLLAKRFVGIGREAETPASHSEESRARLRRMNMQADAIKTAEKWRAVFFSSESDVQIGKQFGVTRRWISEVRKEVRTACSDYNSAQVGAWRYECEHKEDVSWIMLHRLFDLGPESWAGLDEEKP